MSRPQRITVSLPLADQGLDPESLVPVFHEWIRRGAVEGLLIDVARYAHVHHGPGVMLIGHEGDYSIDLAAGEPSLKYTLKHDAPGTTRELVARCLRRVLGAASELAASPGVLVRTDEVVVRIVDRLQAPNGEETLAAIGPEVAAGIADVVGGGTAELSLLEQDPRAAFGVRARIAEPAALAGLAGAATA